MPKSPSRKSPAKKSPKKKSVAKKSKAQVAKNKKQRAKDKAVKEAAKELKRKKKEEKANKPKRARSAYTFFVSENRSKIQSQHADWSFQQLAKALGLAWKNCKNRAHYEKLAKADKARSEKERAAYKKTKPKRAMSAYMFFVKDKRAAIVKSSPDLSFAEVGKALGQAWKDLPVKSRSKYDALAAKDKERAAKAKKVDQKV